MSKFCLKKNNNLVNANPKEDNCSICLNKKTDVATIDCCCHDFCLNCISECVKTQHKCPLCRKKINKIIKKNGEIINVGNTNSNNSIRIQFNNYMNNSLFSILNWRTIGDRDRVIEALSSQNLQSITEDSYDNRTRTHTSRRVQLTADGLGTITRAVIITDISTTTTTTTIT